jgi:signal transduction histidine kinase/ActR/RegA family two-component response regulator
MADLRRDLHSSSSTLHQPLDVVGRAGDGSFSALFETSGEALLVIDAAGVIQRVNRRARELLGMTDARARRRELADFLPGSRSEQLASLSTSGASGASHGLSTSLQNGLPIRVTLRAILPDSLHLLLCLESDIAGNKAAEANWHQLDAELRSVLLSVQAGIILFDSEGQIRFSNPRFGELFDLDAPRLKRMRTLDDLAKGTADRFRLPGVFSVRWKSFTAGNLEPAKEEIEIIRPCPRVLERFSRPVLDSKGVPAGWLEIYSDVTEHRRIQSKMLQTEKMAALGQIVSGIAHESNNPLTAIMGYAQLLLGHGLIDSQLAEARNVYQEAERARRIVKNLLYFARENKPERSVVDLNEIVERTLALRGYELKVENILVQCNLAPDLPKTMADPYQLQQVVLNLVMNAEQALLEKGRPGRVRVRTKDLKQEASNRISLEVSDDGPGIPPEIASRIFDPFFTTKAPGVGTGLGLSIVYGIVRQHDGEVTFESQPGHGAKFLVELPVIPAAAEQRSVRADSPNQPSRATPGRILVVEDEPTVAQLLVDILQEEGHRAEAVLDSQEGLARLSRGPYDLVICDLRMPGLDGRAFYQALARADSPMQDQILFITGDTLAPETLEFLEPNRLPYVAKPFLVEELKSAVNRQLDANRKSPRRAPAEFSRGQVCGEIKTSEK